MTDPNAQQPDPAYPPAQPEPSYPPAQPAAQPYAQPGYGYPAPAPKGLSITSMVLGIAGLVVGWFTFGIGGLASIAAVITGHIALKREPQGRPFSITGLVTGYIGIASAVLVFILVVVVFGIIAANARFTYSTS